MAISPETLFARLEGSQPPSILDVRNETESAHWRAEGRRPVRTLNVPYFEFLEREGESVARVRRWLEEAGALDLVIVCAKGQSSELVADVLASKGIVSESLAGGMRAWADATVVRPIPLAPLRAWQVIRFGKGCLSYVLAEGEEAIVVDPHRHIEAYRELLREKGLRLRAVFDTHLHADHISGAPPLAAAEGVPYYANPRDFRGASFSFTPFTDGEKVRLGGAEISSAHLLHAPGHTPGSSLLRVADQLLLTGDTLFVGSVGRPDLAGRTLEWGRELWSTLHERLSGLPETIRVLPAHAAGPADIGPDGLVSSTLGRLRETNEAFRDDREAFLHRLEAGIPPAPEAYAAIRALNAGAAQADEERRAEIEAGRNECALSRRA